MVELRFSPEADAILSELESGNGDRICAGRLNSALDVLSDDPGAAVNRRHRYQSLDVWGISVRCPDDDWLILWSYSRHESRVVVVDHIVKAP